MVTMIPQIPEPPTPQDPPAQFNQKAADSWAGLYAAVPKMNQQAEEIAQIGAAATAAAGQAAVDSDLALGYKNEAGAARTAAQGAAATAGQHAATAAQAGDDAAQAAVRAEEAAAAAGQRVPMTGMSGAAILPEGTDAERPAPGATGLYVRLSKTSGKPEWYNRTTEAWEPIGDTSQLAAQLGIVDTKVQGLDAATGFTIIYPNGGTAAAPANVAVNSRYVSPNPFPGHHVICIAEVLYAGAWADSGWLWTSTGGQGVKSSWFSDSIVTQTGRAGLLNVPQDIGTPNPSGTFVSTQLPCRVKVWKLKGGA